MDQQINLHAQQKINPTADRQALPSLMFLADRQVFYRCILLTDSVTDERTTACNSGLAQWRFTRKVKLIAINYLCLSGQFSGLNSATAQARKTLSLISKKNFQKSTRDNFGFASGGRNSHICIPSRGAPLLSALRETSCVSK